MIIMTSFRIKQ